MKAINLEKEKARIIKDLRNQKKQSIQDHKTQWGTPPPADDHLMEWFDNAIKQVSIDYSSDEMYLRSEIRHKKLLLGFSIHEFVYQSKNIYPFTQGGFVGDDYEWKPHDDKITDDTEYVVLNRERFFTCRKLENLADEIVKHCNAGNLNRALRFLAEYQTTYLRQVHEKFVKQEHVDQINKVFDAIGVVRKYNQRLYRLRKRKLSIDADERRKIEGAEAENKT